MLNKTFYNSWLISTLCQFQTQCDVDYANWPWGEQNCTYTAGSWTYDMKQVDIQPYLGFSESDAQETPLDFGHLLSKNKVSKVKWKHGEALTTWLHKFQIPNFQSSINQSFWTFYIKTLQYEITGNQYERNEKEYPCCPGEKYPSMRMSFQFKMKHMFKDGQKMTP